MMRTVELLLSGEEAQGMVEYVLIIGMVAVVLAGALTFLQEGIFGSIQSSANKIPN